MSEEAERKFMGTDWELVEEFRSTDSTAKMRAAQRAMEALKDGLLFRIEYMGECLGCGRESFVPADDFPHEEDCAYVAWMAMQ